MFCDSSCKGLKSQIYYIEIQKDTVDENIIATIKMGNNFCYPLKMVIFLLKLKRYRKILYLNFSIAPHLVIALPTLRQKLSLLINLFASILYQFCRLVHGFFSVLLPIYLSLFQLLRQQQLSLFYALKGVSYK